MSVQSVKLSGSAVHGITFSDEHRARVALLPTEVCLGANLASEAIRGGLFMLSLSKYLRGTPTLPTSLDRRQKAALSLAQTLGNDQQGDCVIAATIHLLGLMSAVDSDQPELIGNTAEALSSYHRICGLGDRGCVITDVLDAAQSSGLPIGGQATRIDGYVSVNWMDLTETKTAIYLFGGGLIGFPLPTAWLNSNVWDVTISPTAGGHCVPPLDYDAQGVYVSSWGRVYLMTWAAWQRYVQEFYAALAAAWYGADKISAVGLDANALRSDLQIIGQGGTPPLGPPDPQPPQPQPPEPPVPTPTPPPFPWQQLLQIVLDYLQQCIQPSKSAFRGALRRPGFFQIWQLERHVRLSLGLRPIEWRQQRHEIMSSIYKAAEDATDAQLDAVIDDAGHGDLPES